MRTSLLARAAWGRPGGPIAQRRSFFEHMSLRGLRAPAGRGRRREARRAYCFGAAQVWYAANPRSHRRPCGRDEGRCDSQRRGPALQPADLRGNRRSRLAAHNVDMAMTLSEPHSERPYEEDGREARRPPVRGRGILAGGSACSRSSAWVSSQASFRRFRATPPTTCSRRSDEVGVRDGCEHRRRGLRSSRRPSPSWTTIEECLNPPVIWEQERGWSHDA